MRHLIDAYIQADESEKVSSFDDLSLIQLIVERGADAVDALPGGFGKITKQWLKPLKTMFASLSSTNSQSIRSITEKCPSCLMP